MTQVRYFPRYSQRENFQTNNTLLLLHRLYDFSRFRFEDFLARLLRDTDTETDFAVPLGLQITQQVGTGASVVDGLLYQESFRIAIETKRTADGFDVEQLQRHLSGFIQPSGGFLILLSRERIKIGGPDWAAPAREVSHRRAVESRRDALRRRRI